MKKFLLAYSGVFVLAVAACAQSGPGTTTGTAGTSAAPAPAARARPARRHDRHRRHDRQPAADGRQRRATRARTGTAGHGTAGTSGTAVRHGAARTGTAGTHRHRGHDAARARHAPAPPAATGTRRHRAGAAAPPARAGTGGTAGRGGTTGTGRHRRHRRHDRHRRRRRHRRASPASIVPDLVGFYWEVNPQRATPLRGHATTRFDKPARLSHRRHLGHDRVHHSRQPVFNVKGTTGQKYTVNIEVRGVVGTRCYQNGTRGLDAPPASDSGQNNTWYAGGTQYNDSFWNTIEIHVAPAVTGDDRNAPTTSTSRTTSGTASTLVPEGSDLRGPVHRELPGDGRRHDDVRHSRLELPAHAELRVDRELGELRHAAPRAPSTCPA